MSTGLKLMADTLAWPALALTAHVCCCAAPIMTAVLARLGAFAKEGAALACQLRNHQPSLVDAC